MKKIISTLAMVSTLATVASADFTRVEMGVGVWSQEPTGNITYKDGATTGSYASDETKKTSAYAWMLIKHPIPVVPNLRLEYASVEDKGSVDGTFKDFTASSVTTGSFKVDQYDVIPYYNILDNTAWITLDLGLDIKVLDSSFKAEGVNVNGVVGLSDYEDSTLLAVPMGYARARVEIPATDIGIESDIKYITYSGSTLSDFRVKVDYTFDITPVVQPAIEVGYRTQSYVIETDDDKTKVDMKFSGVYGGLMLRF
ncbi:TIGR04219 family outer membrane beta-barrel protein [Sulfurimonas marina]|uniref:TIGR04219 family outer membrane beta-barrel protein n=1 Tax=Sulfurimonas marina TaxID=2590551 RepID=A0A7M3V968_9BACT|nr:TIGR04219 family outer membrane beta-barrel protein [Sulfurimonas marina]QOP40301.1 TIGR04219 family outer membrane beta-barrel protein [Sulfurimonas marina]